LLGQTKEGKRAESIRPKSGREERPERKRKAEHCEKNKKSVKEQKNTIAIKEEGDKNRARRAGGQRLCCGKHLLRVGEGVWDAYERERQREVITAIQGEEATVNYPNI